jgi:hypothetical protein
MLHFGVTIPATVLQRSEIPEGLPTYESSGSKLVEVVKILKHSFRKVAFCLVEIVYLKNWRDLRLSSVFCVNDLALTGGSVAVRSSAAPNGRAQC